MRSYNVVKRTISRNRKRQLTETFGGIQFLASLRSRSSLELRRDDIVAIDSLIAGYQEMGSLNISIVREYAPVEEEAATTWLNQLISSGLSIDRGWSWMAKSDIKRGDIYYADLSPVVGSEQGGMRPVLIIQNNIGNHYSLTVIVAAITARISKPKMPTHVGIAAKHAGIEKDSVILTEQIRTIDKQRLKDRVAHLDDTTMRKVDTALLVSIGL